MTETDRKPPALELRQVSKVYETAGGYERRALSCIDLVVPAGSTLALCGRSGSGKSTLLSLAAATDFPSSGEVLLHGRSLGSLSEAQRTRVRRNALRAACTRTGS